MIFASTLPKPHEPKLNQSFGKELANANPGSPKGFLSNAQKNKESRVGKGESHP